MVDDQAHLSGNTAFQFFFMSTMIQSFSLAMSSTLEPQLSRGSRVDCFVVD
jgi:hypothetical protein